MEQLPFDRGVFDVVSCRAAVHHVARPERVLAEAARLLAPGGRVVVADMLTSEDAAKAEYHNRVERLCDPTHVRALPATEFERLFAGAGLAVRSATSLSMDSEREGWMANGGPEAAAGGGSGA